MDPYEALGVPRNATADEIKKITAQATEVAKASAVSKRFEVTLAPVEAYTDYWAVPVIEGLEGAPRSNQLKHFGAAMASDMKKWQKVVAAAGIKPQ